MAPISQEIILGLPQSSDTWHFAVRRLRTWINEEGKTPLRPWLYLAASAQTGVIRGIALEEELTADQARQVLYQAMADPPGEFEYEPYRPARVFFEDQELYRAISPDLQAIGIEARHRSSSSLVDEIIESLEEEMRDGRPEVPGLLSQRKLTPKVVGEFFKAAADFYRAAPWVELSNEDPLAVRVGDQKKPYYATVMGQGGVEYGLALYRDWEGMLGFYQPQDGPRDLNRMGEIHSLLFNEVTGVPFADLEGIERYGWEIADPQAYPMPIIFVPPETVKRPELDEILWYTAALQAIPVFVKEHLERDDDGQIQPAKVRLTLSGPKGALPVEITYPAGDLPKGFGASRDFGTDWERSEAEFELPFDPRAMEGQFSHLTGMLGESGVSPAVQKAQELMYQAWDESNPARRLALARKALKISADCADAYVLLAEEQADSLERALGYYQEGVAAGKRALGEAYFAENTGHFWGLMETRPFMRAMEGMARSLWRLGRKEEALQSYQEMLRLNPGDNQGIRYILTDLLQSMNRYPELATLLKQYPDNWSADWLYTKALQAFRESGASRKANRALGEALRQNEHVPAYLTGEQRVPNQLPPYTGMGDEDEAVLYAAQHLNYWRRAPGAVEWLQDQLVVHEAKKQALRDKSGFKVGDSVKVKKRTRDPDFDIDLGGWQGRIREIEVDLETSQLFVLIEWDSQTLKAMPGEAIEESERMGMEWTEMHLPANRVVPAGPRDEPVDRDEIIARLSSQYAWSYLGEQGDRIQAVLEGTSAKDRRRQLAAWERYLQEQLEFPFKAEVAEEQDQEHLQVEDVVEVLGIKGAHSLYGILVEVRKKGYRGAVPLYDLDVQDEDAPQFQPVDDYQTWFENQ
jgi:tetratricopeptide (TPR) repeat protein